jgi:prolyl 4-hydroxylase
MVEQFPNFISATLADLIIEEGNKTFEPATVLGSENNGYRVADSMFINKDSPLVKNIMNDIAKLTELPLKNQEKPHVVRYLKGGEYKPHHDFFHLNQNYTEAELARGGQRTKSALLYLNDNFKGGSTSFPYYDLVIQPEKQKLVTWDNLNPDGTLNMDSLHAGLPVEEGIKYILVIWIRERAFV